MATLPNTQWMTWHDLGRGRHFLAKVGALRAMIRAKLWIKSVLTA